MWLTRRQGKKEEEELIGHTQLNVLSSICQAKQYQYGAVVESGRFRRDRQQGRFPINGNRIGLEELPMHPGQDV
jgi:hypothetical protein